MPGINGMNPELNTTAPIESPKPKGVDPNLEANGNTQQTQETNQPTSVFHQLDSNTNKAVEFDEAKSSIFNQMNTGAQTEVINIKEGSFSFKDLFEKATEKFKDVNYEATNEGVAKVDSEISAQVSQFNSDASALYEKYIQQRNVEAKVELSADKKSLEYKDASGNTFKTEKVTVEKSDDGNTIYRDSNGKMIYTENDSDHSTNTMIRDTNGNLLTATTRDNDGNITSTSTNTYNDKGQRTSRTYTSNGETLTSNYTYNQNGTLASEIVTNENGEVVEERKFDKNGDEISYKSTISSENGTTNINQTFNKGKLKTNSRDFSSNDGSVNGTYTEEYRSNGNLKRSTNNIEINNLDDYNKKYGTENGPATLDTHFSRISDYRRGGELKYETTSAIGTDGSMETTRTKYRGSGTRKWTQSGIRNPDSNITAFRENFDVDNDVKSGSVTFRDNNGKKLDKNKLIVFDNDKNKVPQGYTAVKGYQNHYSNAKGEIFTFVEGDNGKPKPVRDHSSMARLHEARLKRELEKSEQA